MYALSVMVNRTFFAVCHSVAGGLAQKPYRRRHMVETEEMDADAKDDGLFTSVWMMDVRCLMSRLRLRCAYRRDFGGGFIGWMRGVCAVCVVCLVGVCCRSPPPPILVGNRS